MPTLNVSDPNPTRWQPSLSLKSRESPKTLLNRPPSIPSSSFEARQRDTPGLALPMASNPDKKQIIAMAENEMEYRIELYNKLTQTCFRKCVEPRYKEGDLHMGENSCVDRCTSKYWQVTNLVGQILANNRPST